MIRELTERELHHSSDLDTMRIPFFRVEVQKIVSTPRIGLRGRYRQNS
jgi:hypothetical protein